MTLIRAIAALAVATLLAGCSEVSTEYPIGSTTGLAPDPALVGTWRPYAEDGKDIARRPDGKPAAYVHIFPAREGHFTIVMVEHPEKPGDHGDYSVLEATSGRAGENRFLNVVMLPPAGEVLRTQHGTVPVLYRFEANGDLALFKLDFDKAMAAVNAGAIAGKVEKHSYHFDGKDYEGTPDVRITADPATLDTFFAKPTVVDLFNKMGVLKRAD